MTVIAVVNSKGGVSKSTLAINIATAFSRAGKATLIIDYDPRRGTASRWSRTAEEKGHVEVPVVKIESGIIKVVNDLKEAYQVIVIDGPAYLDNANTSLIAIADTVLLPITPSQPDIWAIEEALNWIENRQLVTGGTPLAYVLLSQCHSDPRVDAAEVEEIAQLGHPVLKTRMVNRVSYSRAMKEGTSVFSLPETDKARQEIQAIYEELL
jgi:chromosome partitioning protein